MTNISSCTDCGAMVADTLLWTHQQFHDSQRTFPCALCSAEVSNDQVSLHLDYHARMDRLEVLMQRLLGDVEAHLAYLEREEQASKQ